MTRSDDEILRVALRADAGSAEPQTNGFESVRAAAHGRGRARRRTMLAAVAAVTVVALGAGTVFAVTRDDDNRISAGPSPSTDATTIAPETTTTGPPETTTTAPPATTATTVPVPTTPATGTLPEPTDVAGYTKYYTVGLDTLGGSFLAEAESPQAKVDALVAALQDEPIEGRRGAQGIVNSIEGNRAQIEVRVLGVASDAHAGFDYRLSLLQEQPGGPWKVVAAEARDLCSRAFDGSLCV